MWFAIVILSILSKLLLSLHLILVSICFIVPLLLDNDHGKPLRFGAQSGRWVERVGNAVTAVRKETHGKEGLITSNR